MRRYAWILLASSIWTIYVWGTRVYTLIRQDATPAFKIVHFALVVISIAFAIAVGWVALKLWNVS